MLLGGKSAPALKLGGKLLNADFAAVDRFTRSTDAVASVFAIAGDDFVRVTTSIKDTRGERAIGTLLDRTHPGYQILRDGASYVGLATVFGKEYMTQYDPIKDHEASTSWRHIATPGREVVTAT